MFDPKDNAYHGAMLHMLAQVAITASAQCVTALRRNGIMEDGELAVIHDAIRAFGDGPAGMPTKYRDRFREAVAAFPPA